MIESGGNNKYYDPPERDYAYSRHFGFVQKVVVGWMVVMLGEQGTSFHPLIPTCGRQVGTPAHGYFQEVPTGLYGLPRSRNNASEAGPAATGRPRQAY